MIFICVIAVVIDLTNQKASSSNIPGSILRKTDENHDERG